MKAGSIPASIQIKEHREGYPYAPLFIKNQLRNDMRRTSDVTPTETYPKILWYQIRKPLPSEADQKIIYNNHYKRITEILYKKYPTAPRKDIDEAAVEQAKDMAEKEINKPEALMKVVVNTMTDHMKMKSIIEGSDNFIQWYDR